MALAPRIADGAGVDCFGTALLLLLEAARGRLSPGLSFSFQVSGLSTENFLFGFPNKALEKNGKMRYKVIYKLLCLCILVRFPERKHF
jgi:hypothetical protein